MNTKFKDVVNFTMGLTGIVLGIGIIKKLDEIHDEIKYFEGQKGVYYCKKEHDKREEKFWEELTKEQEEEED